MILRRFFLCSLAGIIMLSEATVTYGRTLTPDPEQLLPLSNAGAFDQKAEDLPEADQALIKGFLEEPTQHILEVMYLFQRAGGSKTSRWKDQPLALGFPWRERPHWLRWEERIYNP